MTMPTRIALALSVISLLLGSMACAQSFDAVRLQRTAPGQDLGVVGLAVLSAPMYAGSEERRTRALPLVDYQWANDWFAGVSNGVGVNLSSDPNLQYGLRVTADLGRKERRSQALRGMGDIQAKAEAGAFFNLAWPGGWQATTSLRHGSGAGGKGLVADAGLGYGAALAPQWRVGASVGLSAVNSHAMRSTFGVDEAQSSRSGYSVYRPGSGLRDVRAGASLTYALDPRNAVMAAASFNRLLDHAADSPLTRQRNTASALLVYTYAF
jgi:outer membrane protein